MMTKFLEDSCLHFIIEMFYFVKIVKISHIHVSMYANYSVILDALNFMFCSNCRSLVMLTMCFKQQLKPSCAIVYKAT